MEKNIKQVIAKATPSEHANTVKLLTALAAAGDTGNVIIETYAALQPETRKEFIDYYIGLYGKEYATDMAKDYINTGKKEKVEASSNQKLQKQALSAPNSDANAPVEDYYINLYGKEYAKDMVSYPKNELEKKEVKAMSKGLQNHLANLDHKIASELLELITESKKN